MSGNAKLCAALAGLLALLSLIPGAALGVPMVTIAVLLLALAFFV